jgi:myo-inositol-1(or 4)-monophosphatase
VVTQVDIQAERAILDILRREYPDFGLLSEESPERKSDTPYVWVVDPLDGSRNYASGVPQCCTVVALARSDVVVVGVTYDPFRDELFTAEEGQGAFLNGRRIHVTIKETLEQCLMGFDLGYADEKGRMTLELVGRLWPKLQGLRLTGSSSLGLAYAAAGRFDIYFHHRLFPWDIAAGLLLVKEAGGVVVDHRGGPIALHKESVVASSQRIVDEFLKATEGLAWRK